MGRSRKFGNPKTIQGAMLSAEATLVPMEMLRNMKPIVAIPITISGASNVVFTIDASNTNHLSLWNGSDFFHLKEALAYTWVAGANNQILNSSGVVTEDQAPATGGWYYYVGINDDGTVVILPSQTEPSLVEGPFPGGHLVHPGTSRVRVYSYVGYHIASATTPAFVAMTKIGFTYNFAALAVATTTTWAELAFTGAKALPKHGALGVTVGGHVNSGVGASSTVVVGSTSSNALGVVKSGSGITTTADAFSPLPDMSPTPDGKLWAQDTVARGDVSVTYIRDVV